MLQQNLSVNDAGHLTVSGVDTVSLAKKYGTPLYVMDEALIRRNMRRYVTAMNQYFPAGSMPLLASKALSFKEIYRIAQDENMGTDIVSAGELYTALAANFPPEKMYFHGSAKTNADVRFAMDAGVGHFIVDNAEELERISRYAMEKGITQKILLRLTPGIDPHTFAAVNTGMVDSKFGVAIETGQAWDFTKAALAAPGVELDGFHCHVGSQITTPDPFLDSIDIMTQFMAQVRRELGYTAPKLNIGGGFAVPYVAEDVEVSYEDFIRQIGAHLTERCQALDYPLPAILMEPGRSIVAAAGVTLYTVESMKSIPGYKDYVAIDGGMTDNPRFALYESRYTALVADRAGDPADFIATIAGRCCESGDLIGVDMPIQRPQVGDTLAVLVTGAYNYSMASNYNRVPRPPVVMLREGQDRLVVRRETFEDMLACDL
jgi:diaminopimelate decarboxylase